MKIQDGSAAVLKVPEPSLGSNSVVKPVSVALPEQDVVQNDTATTDKKSDAPNAEKVQKAVESLNKALEGSAPNRLNFRLDKATDQMQVQVIDEVNNKVIKEIPAQDVLDLMARIKEMVGWFLDERI